MPFNEFDIISSYFQKHSKRQDVVLGIGDDSAVLAVPANKYLLASTDTLNVGTHFFPNALPFDIGYKSAAVSLSDLAAMGAEPAWLLLSLTLEEVNSDWLKAFSEGLFYCLEPYQVSLVGGNTAKGPLSITTQLLGWVDKTPYLRRDKAVPGDHIFVTHTLGDAGLALRLLKGEIEGSFLTTQEREYLKSRLFRPSPRVLEGQFIRSIANACIDLSDGLLADLSHILVASRVGATLRLEDIPLSTGLNKLPQDISAEIALTSGDDYELCFTVPSERLSQLEKFSANLDCSFTCIGQIQEALGLVVKREGVPVEFKRKGYKHFE